MKKLLKKKCFLLDMDGTIYLGDELIDGAKEFLQKLKKKNISYIFLTNNSSKSKTIYLEKLRKMGIQTELENIFTSGEATVLYLQHIHPNSKIFLLGTEALEEEFKNAGFTLVKERGKEVDHVVLGFDTTLTYEKLWTACEYISQNVNYIATHPDFNCPLPAGKFMPDTGSMIALIKASTGKEPTIIGKPNSHILTALMKKYSLKKEDLAIVGDRLYTDIKTGTENGIDSILVLSGETDKQMLAASAITPDYIFDSVKNILK
jgi:NagD protein